jgi:MoaA/NifB/PqqE/SkfB family radical SAM enzyme
MGISWIQASNLIYESAKKAEIPVTASFELTARCNFHCKMCYLCRYADDKEALKKELDAKQWISLGEEARDAGVLFVTLTGGEIFLRKDFRQIYEAFSNMGFNITLHTNGSMITEETAEWLGRIPPSQVSITVYGASPETYEKITGHKDGFERTIRGIKALTDNKIHTEIRTTIIKANQNEFNEMMQLAKELGIEMGVVNYVGPRRDVGCTDPLSNRLTPMETAIYEKKFQDYNYNAYLERTGTNAMIQNSGIEQLNHQDPSTAVLSKTNSSAFKCSAGKYACWFTWDGKLIACGLLPSPAFNLSDKPLQELWNELKAKCKEIPKCPECKDCEIIEHCMACPARLHSETGSFEKKAAYLCETAQCRVDLNVTNKYQYR